jgi:hypothetical protein
MDVICPACALVVLTTSRNRGRDTIAHAKVLLCQQVLVGTNTVSVVISLKAKKEEQDDGESQ